MPSNQKFLRSLAIVIAMFCACPKLFSQNTIIQNTHIRGFIDALASYQNGKASFGFGEQDLFITSELHDRISFLGETVFKYTPGTPTDFSVSVERVVIKYNYYGNHNLLIGKHHTPINYWNDTYHHGRVFFPTIERPLLFAANFIPLHTTGMSAQGQNLGKLRFGYDLMVGNGLGSAEVADNDSYKSITAAVHIKPVENLRLGVSYYNDVISKDAHVHDKHIGWKVNQQLFTGSVAYFGNKFEVLTEGTLALNKTDTTGSQTSTAYYLYGGYKITEKWVPYFRFDNLHYGNGEVFYTKDNTTSFLVGLRYNINYLAVVKLEYQHTNTQLNGDFDKVTFQFAVGF